MSKMHHIKTQCALRVSVATVHKSKLGRDQSTVLACTARLDPSPQTIWNMHAESQKTQEHATQPKRKVALCQNRTSDLIIAYRSNTSDTLYH